MFQNLLSDLNLIFWLMQSVREKISGPVKEQLRKSTLSECIYLRIKKRVACLYGVIMHDGGMLGEYERSL